MLSSLAQSRGRQPAGPGRQPSPSCAAGCQLPRQRSRQDFTPIRPGCAGRQARLAQGQARRTPRQGFDPGPGFLPQISRPCLADRAACRLGSSLQSPRSVMPSSFQKQPNFLRPRSGPGAVHARLVYFCGEFSKNSAFPVVKSRRSFGDSPCYPGISLTAPCCQQS